MDNKQNIAQAKAEAARAAAVTPTEQGRAAALAEIALFPPNQNVKSYLEDLHICRMDANRKKEAERIGTEVQGAPTDWVRDYKSGYLDEFEDYFRANRLALSDPQFLKTLDREAREEFTSRMGVINRPAGKPAPAPPSHLSGATAKQEGGAPMTDYIEQPELTPLEDCCIETLVRMDDQIRNGSPDNDAIYWPALGSPWRKTVAPWSDAELEAIIDFCLRGDAMPALRWIGLQCDGAAITRTPDRLAWKRCLNAALRVLRGWLVDPAKWSASNDEHSQIPFENFIEIIPSLGSADWRPEIRGAIAALSEALGVDAAPAAAAAAPVAPLTQTPVGQPVAAAPCTSAASAAGQVTLPLHAMVRNLNAEEEAVIQGLAAQYTSKPWKIMHALRKVIVARTDDLALYSDSDKAKLIERYKKKESFDQVWSEAQNRRAARRL